MDESRIYMERSRASNDRTLSVIDGESLMNSDPADTYIVPLIQAKIREIFGQKSVALLDIGCGDGYAADQFRQAGCQVRAFDASTEDIQLARSRYPGLAYEVRSVY